jgi:transposase
MTYLLTDAQWARIAPLLPSWEGTKGGRDPDNRRFVEAVRWLLRNGCRWRTLPAVWGNWHTTYTRRRPCYCSTGWPRPT